MRRIFPILLCSAPFLAAQEPAAPLPTLDQLVEQVRATEAKVGSLEIQMRTSGTLPGGDRHEIEGRTRVLGKTHRHTMVKGSMGSVMRFENETVTTPEGTWMRQSDPMQGEVFLRMDAALQKKLADASALLGTPVPGAEDDPLAMAGSKMIEDMRRWFELGVSETRIDGRDYWVLRGPARARGDETEQPMRLGDELEILIDKLGLTVRRMLTFEQGTPKDSIEILSLTLDPRLEPTSFRIELPAGKSWLDVMNHPPSKAMIEGILSDAKEKERDKEKGKEAGK